MQKLIDKFGFNPVQAAGVLGNIGLECDGFHQMLEIGGGGGLGWAQWTGPRRTLFENWCARNGVTTGSDAGNQGYLEAELAGSLSRAVTETRQATTLAEAVRTFMNTFEMPNAAVAHEDRRDQWAQLALAAYQAQHP